MIGSYKLAIRLKTNKTKPILCLISAKVTSFMIHIKTPENPKGIKKQKIEELNMQLEKYKKRVSEKTVKSTTNNKKVSNLVAKVTKLL